MAPDKRGQVLAPAWLYEGVLRETAQSGNSLSDEELKKITTNVWQRRSARLAALGGTVVKTAPPPSFSILMEALSQRGPNSEKIFVTPHLSSISGEDPDNEQLLSSLKSYLELNWLSSENMEQTLQKAKKALDSPHNYTSPWKNDGLTSEQRAESLALKYPYTGHPYEEEAFKEIGEASPEILKAAEAYDILPQAVAAAIIDERSTSNGFKWGLDLAQELWARMGMSLDSVNDDFRVSKRDELADSLQRRASSTYQDIGPGNFKVRSGLRLFEHLALDREDSNPLAAYLHRFISKDAPALLQWEMFKQKMMLEPQGLAYLAAAEMAEGRKLLAPFMRGASPEEEAAILVTWYKQGPFYLKRYLEQRAKEGQSLSQKAGDITDAESEEKKQNASVPVWPDIRPGEGTGCLKYWNKLTDMLGLD